jgi:hypothetical protein
MMHCFRAYSNMMHCFRAYSNMMHNWMDVQLVSLNSLKMSATAAYVQAKMYSLFSRHVSRLHKLECTQLSQEDTSKCVDRTIAQAVRCWLTTSAVQLLGRVRSCGICGEQSCIGAGFLRVLRFPLPLMSPTAPHSASSSAAGTIGQTVDSHPKQRN